MKNQSALSYILLVLVFLTGLSLLLYPTVSDRWNALHQSRVIQDYTREVDTLDNARYDAIWQEAQAYNAAIPERPNPYLLSEDEKERYEALLNVSGTGIMGYIEIPGIGCTLPIYHGTDDSVLQAAVGHVEWSSLPVGGEGTHAILSGHRGLPSARLFTDLDKLVPGDHFLLHVLNDTLTYEVDQIQIVSPEDMSKLQLLEGQDLCTLVTCTPYGINTHRLLVRGHRVENETEAPVRRVTADAVRINPRLVALTTAIPILVLTLVVIYLINTIRRKKLR